MYSSKMIRGMIHPPTDYYCESLESIDDQLCALIARRKEVSGNNPGFPGTDRVLGWCQHYGLNDQMILSIFSQLYNEGLFQPPIVPTRFRIFIPIAKYVQVDGVVYAVTYMKQYANMSVVNVEISLETEDEAVGINARVDLSIGQYTCRQESGSGSGRGLQSNFSVNPPLPDDISGLEFSLKITPGPDIPVPRIKLKAASVVIK